MFRKLLGLGDKPSSSPLARVKAMIAEACPRDPKEPYVTVMRRQMAALSSEERTALYDAIDDWWQEARAFALPIPPQYTEHNTAVGLLWMLLTELAREASTSPERARAFFRRLVHGLPGGVHYIETGMGGVIEEIARAGVILDAPGDRELLEATEAILVLWVKLPHLHKDARAGLRLIGGRPPPTPAQDRADAETVMMRAFAWAAELEAWRDRLLAASPDGRPPIGFHNTTVGEILALNPPEGVEILLAHRRDPPRYPPQEPDTPVMWPFLDHIRDPSRRFPTLEWLRERGQVWRAWMAAYAPQGAAPELTPPAPGSDLERLWTLVSSGQSAKPSAKWLKATETLARELGRDRTKALLIETLAGLRTPQLLRKAQAGWKAPSEYELLLEHVPPVLGMHPATALARSARYETSMLWLRDGETTTDATLPGAPLAPSESDIAFAKGAAWMLAAWPDDEAVDALERVAQSMLAKVVLPHYGPRYRSLAAANACVWSLGQIGSVRAVMALGRIKRAVRDERLAAQIDKAMTEAAQVAGLPVIDLEELAVPTCGLEEPGRVEVALGDYVATLAIEAGRARLSFATAAGKPLKSQPAALKGDAAATEEIKALKQAAAEIDKTLPLLKQRLEDSYLSGRDWSWDDWRARWLDHPLAGALARRLVWRLEGAGEPRQVAWDGEALRDRHGAIVPETPDARVRLWHPLMSQDDEIGFWRAFLMQRRIVQPFAQAHRQLYPLTPAERDTELYSNRFAGHILRQHQYMTLAKSRGWSARHKIWADTPNDDPTYKVLPAHGLYAQWWIASPSGDDEPAVTDSQAFVYVHSDRVLFGRRTETGQRAEEVALETVDPLVFSEIMREVDLCVAVASIGNDPTWADRGRDAYAPNDWRRHADEYWTAHANAPPDVGSKVRAEILAQILPSLAFADRFSLDGQALRVQGKLSAYRIHLGSGNIMMDPSGHYLCIVPAGPAASAADDVYLPFEGDRMLSIILSKALMLARDDKITDAGIVAQIRSTIGQ